MSSRRGIGKQYLTVILLTALWSIHMWYAQLALGTSRADRTPFQLCAANQRIRQVGLSHRILAPLLLPPGYIGDRFLPLLAVVSDQRGSSVRAGRMGCGGPLLHPRLKNQSSFPLVSLPVATPILGIVVGDEQSLPHRADLFSVLYGLSRHVDVGVYGRLAHP
ncbi:hypothetical protein E3N88_25497 [Mikania micrantha]|uniref:Uncharacterized protein n=1 Tax=Mikania micrantha TaxID=192012 RepID=A0A5N6N4W4_9ASTR|nr:hypothetical protein E3N88_25497 [Mikania micrantha]